MPRRKRLILKSFSHCLRRWWYASGGGTLVEAALALAILGIVAAGSVPFYISFQAQRVRDLTDKRREGIIQAVTQYVVAHGHMPAPSENVTSGDAAQVYRVYGYLPFHTLQLPESYAYDGHERPWIYGAAPAFVTEASKGSVDDNLQSFHEKTKGLRFYDQHHRLYGDDQHMPVPMVLISTPQALEEFPQNETVIRPYDGRTEGHLVAVYWVTRDQLLAPCLSSLLYEKTWHEASTKIPQGPSVKKEMPRK